MFDWTTILTEVISVIAGGFGGWFFGRRKYNADVKSSEISNFDSAIDAYKKLYEDREAVLTKQIEDLKEENKDLRRQIQTVSNFITAYMIKNGAPKEDLSEITNIIKSDNLNA